MSSERTDRLEERLAWLERHVAEQDKAMLGLHEDNRRLQRALVTLRLRLAESGGSAAGEADDLPVGMDDRPPHY
ncbi:MAG: SlyX family protein [Verrucomicrobiota bacterium]